MRVSLSQYTELPTTKENIRAHVGRFPSLKHVKVGINFDGVLLTENGKVVAVLQCNVKSGYIVALEVAPEFRSVGLAKRLLQRAATEFKCRRLTVNKSNEKALNLYLNQGYKVVAETPAIYHMELVAR